MLMSTPGLVLHTTPYADSSVVAKVFTRQLGVRSYIIKGVRSRNGRVKQNMLQPLSSLDMVVYDNHRTNLNHIRELSPRHRQSEPDAVTNAMRFFMTEVLYRALREEEPMQELWDYVENLDCSTTPQTINASMPVMFLLRVAHYMGIEPLDNHNNREQYFDLQEGRYVATPSEYTLPAHLSTLLHRYLSSADIDTPTLRERTDLLNALIAYFQLHLTGFHNFTSHEILHQVLR